MNEKEDIKKEIFYKVKELYKLRKSKSKFIQGKSYVNYAGLKNINTELNFGSIAYRDGETMEIKEDVSKLFALGWKPKISIESGIKRTVEYEVNKK